MPLSWNEIKDRALAFAREWDGEASESAEAKSFWDAFFHVFGVTRRRVAAFEAPVTKSDGAGGFIDLLWKGVLLVEHKSRGRDLDRAFRQALDYFPGLKDRDLPRYVLVSDFARFRLYDLDADSVAEFPLEDFPSQVHLFGFIAGYQTRSFGREDPVNVLAAEQLGRLHDQLAATGFAGHPLELFLVRLLFCLFADDTGLFQRRQFQEYLELRTAEDGADLGMHLTQLFQVLNTPAEQRLRNLDEQAAAFPYVNGHLFAELLPIPAFDCAMRETLLDGCGLDWSRISPALFGSLFQSIMERAERRRLGAHYTTETNILKALCPLFLDALWEEFERLRRTPRRLVEFQRRLGAIRVLDPACGCGNFLVIAYRELRLLELEVLRELYRGRESGFLNVEEIVLLDVDQFYGIEIEEFPAQIAQVALWLTDHQMNLRVSQEFGQYFVRLPLSKHPHIAHGNALALDWTEIVAPRDLAYIVGNPPFVGAKFLDERQRAEVAGLFAGIKGAGLLDYVACWYRKAASYMAANPAIRAALVSTNSITQGEQVGALWPELLRAGVRIHFAHRTFQWSSEARGKAAVHCVIIGFALEEEPRKWLFEYQSVRGEPLAHRVSRINPYLVDAPDLVLSKRNQPICPVPIMKFGNQPIDGGHFLFSREERENFLQKEPDAAKWLRPFLGAEEVINGSERWCLWLKDANPAEYRKLPQVMARIEAVKQFRLASKRPATRELGDSPSQFAFVSHDEKPYLVVPSVSSERRLFIPIAPMPPQVIASNLCLILPDATLYHFGILSSTLHNAWTRAVCGRLESRYRYSVGIVYNNFPWPPDPSEKQRAAIEAAAQGVLDARGGFPGASLADLYDPLAMPPELSRAHRRLDQAVDAAYGRRGFSGEAERVAFLFDRYRELTAAG